MTSIKKNYSQLFKIRNQFSPSTVIIAHNYDFPFITGKPAKYAGITTGPWFKHRFDQKNYPNKTKSDKKFRRDIVEIMLRQFGKILEDLEKTPVAKGLLVAVNTQKTLGNELQWLNEMHPTNKGFEMIAKKVYAAMKKKMPGLPNW